MQLTPNLNLKKPEGTDVVDIADLNENADILDAEVAKLASTTTPGRMSAADKTKLDNATNAATASTLVQRDASGRFKAAAPTAADDVARRQEITDHADVKATTSGVYGHTTLVDAVNSTATDKAATANAVKQAYDQASRVAVHIIDIGTDLNTITQPGFYRIQHGHPNQPEGSSYGTMIVTRVSGSDTISQLVFAPTTARLWLRTGNPSAIGGSGAWTAWSEVMTQNGGTFTGAVNINQGAFLANQSPIYGRATDNNPYTLAHITATNVAAFGSPGMSTQLHSSSAPSWWNGSVLREFIHTGGGQEIHGSLVVTGAGSIFANSGTFYLGNPASSSTLSGPHTIMNIFSNSLRFYESGGSNRGASLNLTECLPGAGSIMWHSQNSHRVSVQATAPSPLQVGDVWIDTSA